MVKSPTSAYLLLHCKQQPFTTKGTFTWTKKSKKKKKPTRSSTCMRSLPSRLAQILYPHKYSLIYLLHPLVKERCTHKIRKSWQHQLQSSIFFSNYQTSNCEKRRREGGFYSLTLCLRFGNLTARFGSALTRVNPAHSPGTATSFANSEH